MCVLTSHAEHVLPVDDRLFCPLRLNCTIYTFKLHATCSYLYCRHTFSIFIVAVFCFTLLLFFLYINRSGKQSNFFPSFCVWLWLRCGLSQLPPSLTKKRPASNIDISPHTMKHMIWSAIPLCTVVTRLIRYWLLYAIAFILRD